jgi:hypothetical protein
MGGLEEDLTPVLGILLQIGLQLPSQLSLINR